MICIFIPGDMECSFKDHINKKNIKVCYYLSGSTFRLCVFKDQQDYWLCVFNIMGILETSIHLNTGDYRSIDTYGSKYEKIKNTKNGLIIYSEKGKELSKPLEALPYDTFDSFPFNSEILFTLPSVFNLKESNIDFIERTLKCPHYNITASDGDDCYFFWKICNKCNVISFVMIRVNFKGNITSILKLNICNNKCKNIIIEEEGVDGGSI